MERRIKDLISRADAIEAVEGLTKYMEKLVEGAEKFPEAHTKNYKHDMEQQIVGVAHASQVILELPSADAVSREALNDVKFVAIKGDKVEEAYRSGWNGAIECIIENAPSADAVQGEWVDVENEPYCECSVCGSYIDNLDDDYAFCPRCGARMKGGAE